MRIACIGGGPGGLFFAALAKRANPSHEVVVFERNRAEDTFGFGVVFSDATLARIDAADPVLRRALDRDGVHWDDIELRLKGERVRCGGNGMAAISRRTLLQLLQSEARLAGAELVFEREVRPGELLDGSFDLVIGSDGANSETRALFPEQFGATVEVASAKFIWFGTAHHFDSLTFLYAQGSDGTFAAHCYPIGTGVSTFIVETDESSWRNAGLDDFDPAQPPGPSDERSRAYLAELFADHLAGEGLLVNNSRWGSFRTHRARSWSHGRVVLLGDAAHTAHFSVGSGTKMAMEDAIALSESLDAHPGDLPAALAAYEESARPSVEEIQRSARPSLSWWERFSLYHDTLEPWQFSYHFLTRSISDARLRRRAAGFSDEMLGHFQRLHGAGPLDAPILGLDAASRQGALIGSTDAAAPPVLTLAELRIPLFTHPPADRSPWGLLVSAPENEEAEAATVAAARIAAPGASLVAVSGGGTLTRRLVGEDLRLRHGLTVVLVEPDATTDDVVTAVLSGRADAVATCTPSPTLADGRQV